MDQPERLKKSTPKGWENITDIKDKYQFDLFNWLCSEKDKKKINSINKKRI